MTMIIACPACGTRYAVPENAIGSEGRTVRCAKCKHSWFQEPLDREAQPETAPETEPTRPAPAPERSAPAAAPAPVSKPAPTPVAEQPDSEPAAGPSVSHWKSSDYPAEGLASRAMRKGLATRGEPDEPEPDHAPVEPVEPGDFGDSLADIEPAIGPQTDPLADEFSENLSSDTDELYDPERDVDFATDDDRAPVGDYEQDEDVSRFDYTPPFTTRRNPVKMWTIAAAIFALLATGTIVAVNYYGLPDWAPFNRPTFGIGQPDLELDFPKAQQRTETLENGEEIFRVSGSITNTGRETVTVPSLLIVFRDEREKRVGDWVVAPSKSQLAPGESLNVTEAITDIPVTANAAEIGWSPN